MSEVTHAYLRVKIGGVDITTPYPEHVTGFIYEKKTTAAGNVATIDLYDDAAMQVEAMVIEGYNDIEFAYGLTPPQSTTYHGTVIDWKTTLAGWGAHIELRIMSTDAGTKNTAKQTAYKGAPHEILEKVAEEEGWTLGIIEPTVSIHDTNPKTGAVEDKTYYREGLKAMEFIAKKVLPYARSKLTGACGFMFYADDEKKTINFHTKSFVTDSATYNLTFTIGTRDSNVVDWSPEYSGSAFLSMQGMILEYEDKTGTLQTIVKGKKEGADIKHVRVSTAEEAAVLSDYMWELKLVEAYKGTLEVINMPNIKPFDVISILALTKNNTPHHSSGVYVALSVKDEIESGLIKTTVEVMGAPA